MRKTVFETYESPMIDVISVVVERGFASSIEGWNNGGSYEESLD